jgi:hypothetical protein
MAFVEVHKALGRRAVRGDGVDPKIINRMTAAFVRLRDAMWTKDVELKVKRALADGNPHDAESAMPQWNPEDPESVRVWRTWVSPLKETLLDCLRSSADKIFGEVARKRVKKADAPPEVPTVPIAPATLEWLEEHTGELIKEVSEDTILTVRSIIAGAMRSSLRPTNAEIMARIRGSVGLLVREEEAAQRRYETLLDGGMDIERAERATDIYRGQLLRARGERIARTEAQNALCEGWLMGVREAQDQGYLPESAKMKWNSAPESRNKNRPCEICLALGRMPAVALDAGWDYEGKHYDRPPSHPGCRCSQWVVGGDS